MLASIVNNFRIVVGCRFKEWLVNAEADANAPTAANVPPVANAVRFKFNLFSSDNLMSKSQIQK